MDLDALFRCIDRKEKRETLALYIQHHTMHQV